MQRLVQELDSARPAPVQKDDPALLDALAFAVHQHNVEPEEVDELDELVPFYQDDHPGQFTVRKLNLKPVLKDRVLAHVLWTNHAQMHSFALAFLGSSHSTGACSETL